MTRKSGLGTREDGWPQKLKSVMQGSPGPHADVERVFTWRVINKS